jgi:uncharacterized protein
MLPSELLINRFNGEEIVPKRLKIDAQMGAIAEELIALFQDAKGSSKGELNRLLQELEGEETDYRVKRGLAHLLTSSFSTFETVSPLDPPMLRERVFALSAQVVPSMQNTQKTLGKVAEILSQELEREVFVDQIEAGQSDFDRV